MNFKNIHIGALINQLVKENGTEMSRLCNFFKCTEEDIKTIYSKKSLDAELLLKWSKILEYDFFRVYTQHLILYAPLSAVDEETKVKKKSSLPQFRKNIYTKEIINFVLEQINTKEMTKTEVMERYGIPKTTLYKWISKYKNLNNI